MHSSFVQKKTAGLLLIGFMVCLFWTNDIQALGVSLSTHTGGSLSYLNADFPSNPADTFSIQLTGRRIIPYFYFGLGVDLTLTEWFRIGTGVSYEEHGGILEATMSWNWPPYNITLASKNCDIRFEYDYLQIPLRFELLFPLLIPGNIVVGAAPELGINLKTSARLTF